jgi:hypothetical protein
MCYFRVFCAISVCALCCANEFLEENIVFVDIVCRLLMPRSSLYEYNGINPAPFLPQCTALSIGNEQHPVLKQEVKKAMPMFNDAPRHEDVWKNGGIAPYFS